MTNLHTLSVHSGTFTDEHGAVMPPKIGRAHV